MEETSEYTVKQEKDRLALNKRRLPSGRDPGPAGMDRQSGLEPGAVWGTLGRAWSSLLLPWGFLKASHAPPPRCYSNQPTAQVPLLVALIE